VYGRRVCVFRKVRFLKGEDCKGLGIRMAEYAFCSGLVPIEVVLQYLDRFGHHEM
jgi:hypothetical protein